MKRQLKIFRIKEGDKKLSALEYETLFSRIAATINQRPLVKITEPGLTLCPNDVLHGHNQSSVDQERITDSNLLTRYKTVQMSLRTWWKIYHDDFLKTAKNMYKWQNEKQNLKIGDLCLMLDSPNQVGSYRVCRVVQTYPDDRGLVRKVLVEYSHNNSKIQVKRSSHTLSLLLNEDSEVSINPSNEEIEVHDETKKTVVKVKVFLDSPLIQDLPASRILRKTKPL